MRCFFNITSTQRPFTNYMSFIHRKTNLTRNGTRKRSARTSSNFFIVFRKQSTSSRRFNYFMQTSRSRNFPPVSINTNRHRVYENFFLVYRAHLRNYFHRNELQFRKKIDAFRYTSLKQKLSLTEKRFFIPFHSDVANG